jgi:hypothetical protein
MNPFVTLDPEGLTEEPIPFRIGWGLEAGWGRFFSLFGGFLGVCSGNVAVYRYGRVTWGRNETPAESQPLSNVHLTVCQRHELCLQQAGLHWIPRSHLFFRHRDWAAACRIAALAT